jgi:hypothetical protein
MLRHRPAGAGLHYFQQETLVVHSQNWMQRRLQEHERIW